MQPNRFDLTGDAIEQTQRNRISALLIIISVAQVGILCLLAYAGIVPRWMAVVALVVGACFVFAIITFLKLIGAHVGLLRTQLIDKNQQLQSALVKVDELISRDPLTGAFNRRCLNEMLERELQRAYRTGHPFCFAIIDLDDFKLVNDKYGRPAGDVVLKALSDTALRSLRVLDSFGRLGGEQFGIVMPATWLDQGMIALERLNNAVAGADWKSIAPSLAITYSAGITANALGDTIETITQRADEALSQAKREGRNRVVQIEQPVPDVPLVGSE